ncbi:hypothetical protein RLIN73S_00971 [Rhodanobacter lindaniclasticus]
MLPCARVECAAVLAGALDLVRLEGDPLAHLGDVDAVIALLHQPLAQRGRFLLAVQPHELLQAHGVRLADGQVGVDHPLLGRDALARVFGVVLRLGAVFGEERAQVGGHVGGGAAAAGRVEGVELFGGAVVDRQRVAGRVDHLAVAEELAEGRRIGEASRLKSPESSSARARSAARNLRKSSAVSTLASSPWLPGSTSRKSATSDSGMPRAFSWSR